MKIRFLKLFAFVSFFAVISCNSASKTGDNATEDKNKTDSIVQIDLLSLSDKIVASLKEKNFKEFVEFIDPAVGVRFSASSFIDTATDKVLGKDKILELSKTGEPFTWGIHEAIGEPIKMNINKYTEQYICDQDFVKEAKKQLNKSTNTGSTSSNIKTIYPNADFVEYYFKGKDKKSEGLDWKVLTLIFKKVNDKVYLIGIVHAQWTP